MENEMELSSRKYIGILLVINQLVMIGPIN